MPWQWRLPPRRDPALSSPTATEPHSHLGTSAPASFCPGLHPVLSPRVTQKGSLCREEWGRGTQPTGAWAWGESHCRGSQSCGDGCNLSRERLPAWDLEHVRSAAQTQRSGQSGMGTWGPRGAPWAMLEWGAVPWAGSPAVGRGPARVPAGEQGERREPTDLRVCGRQPPQAGAREKADPLSRSLFACPNPPSEAQQLGWARKEGHSVTRGGGARPWDSVTAF